MVCAKIALVSIFEKEECNWTNKEGVFVNYLFGVYMIFFMLKII